MQCDKCKFCKVIEAIGECHRFPPKPDGQGKHTIDKFPTVHLYNWCGEFKKGAKKK